MQINIEVPFTQIGNIESLAKALKWKEISRNMGKATVCGLGGIKGYPAYYLTYEAKSTDNTVISFDLNILNSSYLIKYNL